METDFSTYDEWLKEDMEKYKKYHPDDQYCNFYVRGWEDGSCNIGDWIMSHQS